MSAFEIIVMLMLVVLPSVFKLIGKSLSNAGQDSKSHQMKEIMEALFDEKRGDSPVAGDDAGHPVAPSYEGEVFPVLDYVTAEADPEPVRDNGAAAIPQELLEGGYMSVREIAGKRKDRANAQEAVSAEKKMVKKIDPKKLVLYSEIMKTKF